MDKKQFFNNKFKLTDVIIVILKFYVCILYSLLPIFTEMYSNVHGQIYGLLESHLSNIQSTYRERKTSGLGIVMVNEHS